MLALFKTLHETRRLLRELESDHACGLGPLRDRVARLEAQAAERARGAVGARLIQSDEATTTTSATTSIPALLESALAIREEAFGLARSHHDVRSMLVEMMD